MSLTREQIAHIFSQAKAVITGDHFVYAKKETGWFHGSDYVNKDAVYPDTDATSILCREIASHFADAGIQTVVGPTVGGVALAQWTAYWFNQKPRREWICEKKEDKVLAVCADEEDVLEERELYPKIPEVCPKDPLIIVEFSATGKVIIENVAYFGCLAPTKIRYFEKVGTRRVIKRGYGEHVKGRRCLVVEDVINTGLTVQKTVEAARNAGGEVIGVGALCNRSGSRVTDATLVVPRLVSLLDLDMKMYPEDSCPICQEKGPESVRQDLGKGKDFLIRKGLLKV
jgi:orotate phosphoribosyltransferase